MVLLTDTLKELGQKTADFFKADELNDDGEKVDKTDDEGTTNGNDDRRITLDESSEEVQKFAINGVEDTKNEAKNLTDKAEGETDNGKQ